MAAWNKQTVEIIRTGMARAVMVAALMLTVAGCGANGAAGPAPAAQSTAAAEPDFAGGARVVTNLSQLSAANTTSGLIANQTLLTATPKSAAAAPQNTTDVALARLYLANPTANTYTGDIAPPPGDTTLLNAKARQYPEFCYAILRQTLKAAQSIEAAKFGKYAMAKDLKPVILRLTMTAQGRLTDIAIEQRSGVAKVDQAMIDACKIGAWAMNPPPQALSAAGNYQIRFEGLVQNYSYGLNGEYKYATHVGLALL